MFIKIIILFVLLITPAVVFGQNPTEISPEKKAALVELSSILVGDNRVEQMAATFSSQMSIMYDGLIEKIVSDRRDLSPAQKKEVKDLLAARRPAGQQRLVNRLLAKMNLTEMTREINITVYDKYFTTEEVNDLIVFYRSAAGKKALELAVPMAKDILEATNARLIPNIGRWLEEVEAEERGEIEKQLPGGKPKQQ